MEIEINVKGTDEYSELHPIARAELIEYDNTETPRLSSRTSQALAELEDVVSPSQITSHSKLTVANVGFAPTDIAYGAGKFIAIGNNGKVAWSTDGESWTEFDNLPADVAGQNWKSIAYDTDNTNVFMIIPYGAYRVLSTTDAGTTWTWASQGQTVNAWLGTVKLPMEKVVYYNNRMFLLSHPVKGGITGITNRQDIFDIYIAPYESTNPPTRIRPYLGFVTPAKNQSEQMEYSWWGLYSTKYPDFSKLVNTSTTIHDMIAVSDPITNTDSIFVSISGLQLGSYVVKKSSVVETSGLTAYKTNDAVRFVKSTDDSSYAVGFSYHSNQIYVFLSSGFTKYSIDKPISILNMVDAGSYYIIVAVDGLYHLNKFKLGATYNPKATKLDYFPEGNENIYIAYGNNRIIFTTGTKSHTYRLEGWTG